MFPLTLLALALFLVVGAPAAHADPAVPTNYRSTVVALDPPVDGIEVEVLGGDAFLRLTAAPGREAVVYGYGRGGQDPEPYLRYLPDGRVEANVRSPAHYLNDDRLADATIPPGVSVDAEPQWEPVASGGTFAWHDHRTHLMAAQPPREVRANPGVHHGLFDWEVPILVDGELVVIRGELEWLPSRSPLAPIVAGILLLALALLAGRRGLVPARLLVVAGGAIVAVLGVAELAGTPVDRTLAAFGAGVGIASLATAVAGALLAERRPLDALRASLAGAALGAAYVAPRLGAIDKPIVPSVLPPTAIAFGLLVALALAAAGAATLWLARPARPGTADPSEPADART